MAIGQVIDFKDSFNTQCEVEIGRMTYNDGTEDYLTDPQLGTTTCFIVDSFTGNLMQYILKHFDATHSPYCFYIDKTQGIIRLMGCDIDVDVLNVQTGIIVSNLYNLNYYGITTDADSKEWKIDTNIPCFESYADAADYYNELDEETRLGYLVNALNYFGGAENESTTEDYYIFNTYDTCSIDLGIVTYTGTNPTGRFEIFKANHVPAFFMNNPTGSCEMTLLYSEIVGSCYSSINKYDAIQKQFDPNSWTDGALYYTGPWYNTLEYLPDGDYTIGVTLDTNIPIFNSRSEAEGYINGTVPIENAINYGNIGRPDIASNETGTVELITTFGNNESENVFSHDYLMSLTELQDVGGKFFDTNIITALLDGLKIYGNDPMESVLSCIYFPFDLTTVCTDAESVTDIYFGSYKMENVSAKKVHKRDGYKELGQTFIKPTFYNFLDYCALNIYLYLPYIGFVELDVNKYLNKWLKLIYMIDIHSGECEVSLTADGLLMDTYSGQIGIKQAVTWQDLSSYFQAQITALRNGVMTSVGLPLGGAATGAQTGGMAGPYGAIAGAAVGSTIGGIAGHANAYWTGYKFAKSNPPLFSKGGYSSEIGANMPQYPFLVFMYNDVEIPANLTDLYGRPSNKSGTIGSFSGFLSTNSVQLQVPTATDAEKTEILSLLNNGIYI